MSEEDEADSSKSTKQKNVESQKFPELLEILEELEHEEKPVGIQICPSCMSPRISRAHSTGGDMSGIIAALPVKYECLDCGWQGRIVIKATSKPATKKRCAILTEANAADYQEYERKKVLDTAVIEIGTLL